MQPKIDPEFKALLAPLTKEEYAGLEESILERGCLDTIKTWDDYIIDGHNRFSICMRHGLLFDTEPLDFDTRDDVITWMIRNQLNRRNQTPEQISYFRGKLYEQMKKAEGGNQRPLGHNAPVVSERTSAKVAEQYGVDEKTIRRDADYAKAVDTIAEHVGDDVKQQILSGEINLPKSDIVEIAALPADEQREIVAKGEAEILKAAKEIKARKSEQNIAKRQERLIEKTKQEIAGRAFITHADCQSIADIPSFDLLIADPPYFSDGDYTEIVGSFLARVKPTGQAYVFCSADPEEIQAYFQLTSHAMTLEQVLVWNYNNTGQKQPSNRYNSNFQIILYYRGLEAPPINKPGDGTHQYACQTVNAPDGRIGDRFHSWQKPLELIERLVLNSSSEGQIVLDPFACTGTTLLAAAKYNRTGIGYEINREFVDIAIKRGCEYVA